MDYRVLLLGIATVVYGIGYFGFVREVLKGNVDGLVGVFGVVMATALFLALIAGLFFMRWLSQFMGEA